MKRRKLKIWFAVICTSFCICIMPNVSVKANSAQYEIVFKAGLHGTINNEKSVSYPVAAGDIFPDEPIVSAQAGYVFKGWSKELPAVGSLVEGKQTFVAQYDVLVSGVNYIVRYVNEDDVEIATPKSSMAEAGDTITERAKVIPGYAYQNAQQQLVVNEKENIITFIYTLTDPNEVIIYEDEVINQETPSQNENQGNENVNEPTDNPGNEDVSDPERDDIENVDDNETPLANGEVETNYNYVLIGGCGILLVALLGFFIYKKKKQVKHKNV